MEFLKFHGVLDISLNKKTALIEFNSIMNSEVRDQWEANTIRKPSPIVTISMWIAEYL